MSLFKSATKLRPSIKEWTQLGSLAAWQLSLCEHVSDCRVCREACETFLLPPLLPFCHNMAQRQDVYVINLNCVPSALIERAFRQLPAFARLRMVSSMYWNAVTTNTNRDAAFHDLIMQAPLGHMCDSARYPWSVPTQESSVFDLFRAAGYETEMWGAFGLDPSLDPHVVPEPDVVVSRSNVIERDKCEPHDSAFLPCGLASAHDAQTLRRATESASRNRDDDHHRPPRFMVVNLLGCEDVARYGADAPAHVARRAMASERAYPSGGDPARFFSQSVTGDDPRNGGSGGRACEIPALRARALFDDACTGGAGGMQLLPFVHRLHDMAWEELCAIDSCLGHFLDALRDTMRLSTVACLATNVFALREHGACAWGPWVCNTRSFLALHLPGQTREEELRSPISLAALMPMVLESAGLGSRLPYRPSLTHQHVPLTLSLAPSNLASASLVNVERLEFVTHFIRALVGEHSLIMWFSTESLLLAGDTRDKIGSKRTEWPNPLLGRTLADLIQSPHMFGCQIYNLGSDPQELCDLSLDPYWLSTPLPSQLKDAADRAMLLQYPNLRVQLPLDVLLLDAVKCTRVRRAFSQSSWLDWESYCIIEEKEVDRTKLRPRLVTVFIDSQGEHPDPVHGLIIEAPVSGTVRTLCGTDLRFRLEADGQVLRVGDRRVISGPELLWSADGAVVKYRVEEGAAAASVAAAAVRGAARQTRKQRS